jgi:hypothetical protein
VATGVFIHPLLHLHLPRRLVDHDLHGQELAVAAVARAADGRGVEVVEAAGDTDVVLGRAGGVGRIEADPAEPLDMGLGPGVARLLVDGAVGMEEVAADIARRDVQVARLGEGGREVECGWLKDRYGLSWQIVPRMLPEALADADRERAARVMRSMMTMVKLDIAALEAAGRGQLPR